MKRMEQGKYVDKKYAEFKYTIFGALIGSGIGMIATMVYYYYISQLPK